MSHVANTSRRVDAVIGVAAILFSALYLVSDLIELAQGGFSTLQLTLTYAAEAAIPLFVLGLCAAQRPRIGSLGMVSAVAYAYAFVFFTSTVVFALVDNTADWTALEDRFGFWISVHSVIMVASGIAFGIAVVRARLLAPWTGYLLAIAMVLMAVATSLPDAVQTFAAGTRDVAFAGMGASLLSARTAGEPRRESADPSRPLVMDAR